MRQTTQERTHESAGTLKTPYRDLAFPTAASSSFLSPSCRMKNDRVKAAQKRLISATRRVTSAKKILAKANKAVNDTRKRIVAAKAAQKKAAKQ